MGTDSAPDLFWEMGEVVDVDEKCTVVVDATQRRDGARALSIALREGTLESTPAPEMMIAHLDTDGVRRLRDMIDQWLVAGGDVKRLIGDAG